MACQLSHSAEEGRSKNTQTTKVENGGKKMKKSANLTIVLFVILSVALVVHSCTNNGWWCKDLGALFPSTHIPLI